jgi:hypothetical protein
MAERKLPTKFAELEPFVGWALATERDRTARRHAVAMGEIRAFYDAMMAQLDEILKYFEGFALENVPDDVNRLFLLTLSLAEVAPAVENFDQPGVVDGYDFSRFVPLHD